MTVDEPGIVDSIRKIKEEDRKESEKEVYKRDVPRVGQIQL